jgi:hypothetical protein
VLELKLLAHLEVALRGADKRLDGRHVHHPALGEVNDDLVWVVHHKHYFQPEPIFSAQFWLQTLLFPTKTAPNPLRILFFPLIYTSILQCWKQKNFA